MLSITYVLQAFAVLFGVGAITLMAVSAMNGRLGIIPIQAVILAMNVGLFMWQASIRGALPHS